MNVLIIDNDKDTSEILKYVLTIDMSNWGVDIASTPLTQNLKLNKHYDIILVDHWTMKDLSMKQFMELSNTSKIVLMTTIKHKIETDFKNLKFDKILSKPFNYSDLESYLKSIH